MRLKALCFLTGLTLSFYCAWADEKPTNLGTITVVAPAGWKSITPSSTMRKAQFALPKVKDDMQDAELVVFNFGAGQGGGVQANLDRWYGQFRQSDGSETKSKAKVSTRKVDGMAVTRVEVGGTYVAPKQIGNPAAGAYNEPNFHMVAAIVEAPDSGYYFKLVGPGKTVAHWAKAFDAFVDSAKKVK